MEFVGRMVRKDFKGFGVFLGVVKSCDSSTGFFEIVYEDGDSEEVDSSELANLLDGVVADQNQSELTKKQSRVGRKPKKRRRFQIQASGADSGNNNHSATMSLTTKTCLNPDGLATRTLERESVDFDSFNSYDVNVINRNVDINVSLNDDGLGLNDESNINARKKSRGIDVIDLNLDINVDENWGKDPSGDSYVKSETCLDLNTGLVDETRNTLDVDLEDGKLKENMPSKSSDEMHEGEISGGSLNATSNGDYLETSAGAQMKGHFFSSNNRGASETEMKDLSFANQGNTENKQKEKRGRKRKRNISDTVNSGAETVLRRSSRRGRAVFSVQGHVPHSLGFEGDILMSPAYGTVSEVQSMISGCEESKAPILLMSKLETTISGCEKSEEPSFPSSKLQLPQSSENLNLDGIPILSFFSVYTFLRSFSTILFLSPFHLEDFLASLRCTNSNLLIDYIHVSLLQTLRKHLEFLSNEISPPASTCLRGLNWDFLDIITWPIFMVEYLLDHCSGMKLGFDLCQLKLFEGGYYKQPEFVKVEILRCLCDDVLEVEPIRLELNRRTLVSEPNSSTDFDRNTKFEVSMRRRAMMDVSGSSCMTEEEVDETTDWNSDECCLCKMDGSLICCDGCPAAFHSRCVGVATSLLPEGEWYCPECLIDWDKPCMKVGKSIRGAELLGIDLHGRLYYSSCGYLLVSDSCDIGSSFHYYHSHDLTAVIEVLKSMDRPYSTILSTITKHWDTCTSANGGKSDVDSHTATLCSESPVNGQTSTTSMLPVPLLPSETCAKDEIVNEGNHGETLMLSTFSCNLKCQVSDLVDISPLVSSMKVENSVTNNEGSATISQALPDFQNVHKTGVDGLSMSAGASIEPALVGDPSFASTSLKAKRGKSVKSSTCGFNSSKVGTTLDISLRQCGTDYVNFYSFARIASEIAGKLTRTSSDKISQEPTASVEELISAQLKAITKTYAGFFWSNIQNLNADARKEKCGWCFFCKVPDADGDCLFVKNNTAVLESFTCDTLGVRTRRNGKGHLVDIMCHALSLEDRLHGLLLGPWLNPHFPKLWRKSFLRPSDFASVKKLLLLLESNVRPLALSAEWLKHVDTVAIMGSASHVVISPLRLPSKHVIGRKRSRCSDLEPHPSTNAATGLGLYWWRGGRHSRQLFNWKVLPRALASKAARQGGCQKIKGILYPDNSDFAKRSKYVAWRAAVETSVSVEQLALQVRELDANIRWDDIENTNHLLKMEKDSKKSLGSFKKVVIRRKCSEGSVVKYLLDFGKRRFIPDIVARHGSKLEESSSEKKKYWLQESYIPLHLLKVFEEKKIARKSNKMNSGKLPLSSKRAMKTPFKKIGFSYLFSRAQRSENYQCGHCNKDVLIREAVSCHYCEGFFHKRHVRKSSGPITAGCSYTCHKCWDALQVNTKTKKGKSQLQKHKKASDVLKPVRSKISRKAGKERQLSQSQAKRKISVVPLRRSARKTKSVLLQSKKTGVKGKQPKSRKRTTNILRKDTWQKKRTPVHYTYWLNGLFLSTKPNDERVADFRGRHHLAPFKESTAIFDPPKCSLCCEPEFTRALNYISCEICGDWFHGDAFGLRAEVIGNLIGFKCHRCLKRTTPVCPHIHGMRIGEAHLDGSKNDLKTENVEEVSNGIALSNVVFVTQKSDVVDESKDLFVTDERSDKEHAETVPGDIRKPALDGKNGHLPITFEKRIEETYNSDEKDLSPPDMLMELNEKTLSNDYLLANIIVETESKSPKNNNDDSGTELRLFRNNHVRNGLAIADSGGLLDRDM